MLRSDYKLVRVPLDDIRIPVGISFRESVNSFFSMKNSEWEFASSPVIYDNVLVIQCDVLENSFVAAYDVKTGKELWKTERDEYPGWCTPNIYTHAGKTFIAVNGYKHRGGYDFKTGKEVWKMSGGGDIRISTPITGEGLIYFNSAHGRSSPIIAVKKSATGDITLRDGETSNEGVLWSIPGGGSYMHTLLLYRNCLYNVNRNGQVACLDPLTWRSSRVSSTESVPVFSARRSSFVVPGIGTIHCFCAGSQASAI